MQSAPQIHAPLPQIGRDAHATDFTSAGARSEDRDGRDCTTHMRAPTGPHPPKKVGRSGPKPRYEEHADEVVAAYLAGVRSDEPEPRLPGCRRLDLKGARSVQGDGRECVCLG